MISQALQKKKKLNIKIIILKIAWLQELIPLDVFLGFCLSFLIDKVIIKMRYKIIANW